MSIIIPIICAQCSGYIRTFNGFRRMRLENILLNLVILISFIEKYFKLYLLLLYLSNFVNENCIPTLSIRELEELFSFSKKA